MPADEASDCFAAGQRRKYLRAVRFVFDSAVAGEEHAASSIVIPRRTFLDIHKNDVFVGRFQHEISSSPTYSGFTADSFVMAL